MKKEEITNDKLTSSQFDSWKQLFTKNLIIEHIYSGNTQQLDPVRSVQRHIYQYILVKEKVIITKARKFGLYLKYI